MAYEGPESDIMKRKPRDPKSDNLVTLKLLQYTYMQIGIIQACAGFFCYFVVLASCGFSPKSLFDDDVGPKWPENTAEGSDEYDQYESITDDYGQEHDVNSRMRMLRSAQTSYFTSIVIVQWADLLICKTRVLSLFQQGLRNWTMNKALVFETVLAIFLVYTPGMTSFFQTGWLIFRWWLPALSFSALILVYDEIRKYFIRRDRRTMNWETTGKIGWVEKVTYY
jgi:sodium/potassium-transporting ATPase subunit alpha